MARSRIRKLITTGAVSAVGITASLLITSMTTAAAADSVAINGNSHIVDGCNIPRATNFLVAYTRTGSQVSSPANQFGFEAAVVGNKVTETRNGQVGMPIPVNGVVLSGHGTSRTWLSGNAIVGADVTLPACATGASTPPPPGSPEVLPDLAIRTVTKVSLDTTSTPGMHKLRFQTVTANIGAGKFEINGVRPSTATTNFTVTQRIYHQNGGTTDIPSAATFYFAGDGHNHWHVRDLDRFVLHNISTNAALRTGAKHGFCFEDNTSYRDWPGNPLHPASPANPFYAPPKACALNQPNTLTVQEGLSVGWSDTYPPTLPDQYIDVTGLPSGTYRLRQTADWAGWFKESNETNNTATADITITATTATLGATSGGV